MTARDEVLELLAARMRDLDLPIPTKRAQMLLAAYDAERRTEVLREAANAVDAFADAAEQDAIANDGQAYGRSNRTVAAYREAAEVVHRMAGATTPTSKEQQR